MKLNRLALINLIALQRRFNGQESVPLVKVNVSMDGQEWRQVQTIEGIKDDEDIAQRQIEPSNARFVRLIPVVDRTMPVCIRTEIFGCYREDNLHHYQLSKASKRSDKNLDSKLAGVGSLANGDTSDFMVFEPEYLKLDFQWTKPRNISCLGFHIYQQNSCLQSVSIKTGQNFESFNNNCNEEVGHTYFQVKTDILAAELELHLVYSGKLRLSEIEWSCNATNIEQVELEASDKLPDQISSEIIGNELVLLGSVRLLFTYRKTLTFSESVNCKPIQTSFSSEEIFFRLSILCSFTDAYTAQISVE